MSKIVKRLLYLILGVALISNMIATNTVLNEETNILILTIMEVAFDIPENIFSLANLINNFLTYGVLLVIINVINVTNKNTEITQGTLDNKQNQTLKGLVLLADSAVDNYEYNGILTEEFKQPKIDSLKKYISLTTKLSNTVIDFKSVDVETKIQNQQNFISMLTTSLEDAEKYNDPYQIKQLLELLSKAQKVLAELTKSRNVT
jgi:hypothetical protein